MPPTSRAAPRPSPRRATIRRLARVERDPVPAIDRRLLKRYFITGLLIWVPLAITAWVLSLIVRTMDQSLLLLPAAIRPENLLGIYIPGIGVIATLLVVFLTGLVTAN